MRPPTAPGRPSRRPACDTAAQLLGDDPRRGRCGPPTSRSTDDAGQSDHGPGPAAHGALPGSRPTWTGSISPGGSTSSTTGFSSSPGRRSSRPSWPATRSRRVRTWSWSDTAKLLVAAAGRVEVADVASAEPVAWTRCPCRGRDTFVRDRPVPGQRGRHRGADRGRRGGADRAARRPCRAVPPGPHRRGPRRLVGGRRTRPRLGAERRAGQGGGPGEGGRAVRSRESSRSSAAASRRVRAGRFHLVWISLRIDVWSWTWWET